MKWIAEAEQLEEVGRSPQSSPTWQLAQMAAEARPSMLGREEPARKKLWPTVGSKAPWKEFLKAGNIKKTRSTDLEQVPFMRSGGSKRAQSSLFGNSPSHS